MDFRKSLVLALAFLIPSFWVPADTIALSCEDCLKGLGGVEVLVEEMKAELENYNLTAVQIQMDVETKLREAEIKILSKEENEIIQPLRRPYLYVKINSRKLPWKREVVAYDVEVSLKQLVTLPGQPKSARKPFYAPTWYGNFFGAAAPRDFGEIREEVNQILDKFIKTYQTANPKP